MQNFQQLKRIRLKDVFIYGVKQNLVSSKLIDVSDLSHPCLFLRKLFWQVRIRKFSE